MGAQRNVGPLGIMDHRDGGCLALPPGELGSTSPLATIPHPDVAARSALVARSGASGRLVVGPRPFAERDRRFAGCGRPRQGDGSDGLSAPAHPPASTTPGSAVQVSENSANSAQLPGAAVVGRMRHCVTMPVVGDRPERGGSARPFGWARTATEAGSKPPGSEEHGGGASGHCGRTRSGVRRAVQSTSDRPGPRSLRSAPALRAGSAALARLSGCCPRRRRASSFA